MARNKTMICKAVSLSEKFQNMRHEAQALYYLLSLSADAYGAVSPITPIMKGWGYSPDAFAELGENGYVAVLTAEGQDIAVLRDWWVCNDFKGAKTGTSLFMSTLAKELCTVDGGRRYSKIEDLPPSYALTNPVSVKGINNAVMVGEEDEGPESDLLVSNGLGPNRKEKEKENRNGIAKENLNKNQLEGESVKGGTLAFPGNPSTPYEACVNCGSARAVHVPTTQGDYIKCPDCGYSLPVDEWYPKE